MPPNITLYPHHYSQHSSESPRLRTKSRKSLDIATMPLHQLDYIMALGTVFAFLDAWNIGALELY